MLKFTEAHCSYTLLVKQETLAGETQPCSMVYDRKLSCKGDNTGLVRLWRRFFPRAVKQGRIVGTCGSVARCTDPNKHFLFLVYASY